MKRSVLIAAACLFAAGCSANLKYTMDNYGSVQKTEFRAMPPDGPQYVENAAGEKVDRSRVFWIFDRPSDARLLISDNPNDAYTVGTARAWTLGLVDPMPKEDVFRSAAQQFLKSDGRSCAVTSIRPLEEPQYEVNYQC